MIGVNIIDIADINMPFVVRRHVFIIKLIGVSDNKHGIWLCFQDLTTMGPQEDYIEMVLTCEGDFYDPNFHVHLEDFSNRLQDLITGGNKTS